jgi:hypothetical protein
MNGNEHVSTRKVSRRRAEQNTLEPVYEHGVLQGLQFGKLLIPRPVLGIEHEFNIAARVPPGLRQQPDVFAISALLEAVDELGGRPARGYSLNQTNTIYEQGRRILPVAGLPVHFYSDCWKFETCFGVFTDAKLLLAFRCKLSETLRAIAKSANAILTERHNHDPHLLLHLSGGDGESTCASLHLNIPWNDTIADACYVTYEAFDLLCESLARQLLCTASVAANGMPTRRAWLTNSRTATFATIVGACTVAPNRALQHTRRQSRPTEGYDRPGIGRNMAMCYVWGQSQRANFLTAVLAQLETIRLHLAVLGMHRSPKLLNRCSNVLKLGRYVARDQRFAAKWMQRVLDDYYSLCQSLELHVGKRVLAQLVPHYQEAIELASAVVRAILDEDEDTLIWSTDLAKKEALFDIHFKGDWRNLWASCFSEARNLCFDFSSPNEDSLYQTIFIANEGERFIVTEREVQEAGPDPLTRTWLMGQIVDRFWDDPAMDYVEWDWDLMKLTRGRVRSCGWIPAISIDTKTICMPNPLSHNARSHGNALANAPSLEDLFDAIGQAPSDQNAQAVAT